MALLTRKSIILAKIESVYGTDSVPVGATDAILCNIDPSQITPIAGSTIERANMQPHLGAHQQIHVDTHVIVPFSVELAGAGAAGTAPPWGKLLLACGWEETVNIGVDVDYDPVSVAAMDSLSIYFSIDGQTHALVGARGTVTLEANMNQIPMLNFVFTGLWVDPASATDPVPTLTAFQTPVPINNANTSVSTLHTVDTVLNSLSIDCGNTVQHMDRPNENKVQVTDRVMTGSLEFQAGALSVQNWFTVAKANTLGAFALTHGPADNRVTVTSATAQILQPKYGNFNGEATISANLQFPPSSVGNDELQIKVL